MHLEEATKARSYMENQAKEDIEAACLPSPILACQPACTREVKIRYSFDFAQQVCNHNALIHSVSMGHTTGPLSTQPSAAWPDLFLDTKKAVPKI